MSLALGIVSLSCGNLLELQQWLNSKDLLHYEIEELLRIWKSERKGWIKPRQELPCPTASKSCQINTSQRSMDLEFPLQVRE